MVLEMRAWCDNCQEHVTIQDNPVYFLGGIVPPKCPLCGEFISIMNHKYHYRPCGDDGRKK